MTDAETASTVSSPESAEKDAEKKSKLNDFLSSCEVTPLGNRARQEWSSASESTKKRYLDHAADAVAALLKVLLNDDAAQLWKTLQASNLVNERLGRISSTLPSERPYLEALAEAYKIASSWDTRRQILSIIAGVASYKAACEFIPGLTAYRYSVASLHSLQYGRGAPVPEEHSARLRIERNQLDHFLSFITSPHLVQDLPFGEKVLVLSTGDKVTVPNVIRTMIPQRIAQQYKSFCQETNFNPFSERTMLRILSACTASIRKSLQGLDYFAANGSKAFEDLAEVVKTVPLLEPEPDWKRKVQDSLKAGKMYLKGDYKVGFPFDYLQPNRACRRGTDSLQDTYYPFLKAGDSNLSETKAQYHLFEVDPVIAMRDALCCFTPACLDLTCCIPFDARSTLLKSRAFPITVVFTLWVIQVTNSWGSHETTPITVGAISATHWTNCCIPSRQLFVKLSTLRRKIETRPCTSINMPRRPYICGSAIKYAPWGRTKHDWTFWTDSTRNPVL